VRSSVNLFDKVILAHSDVSRAHNNRAVLLIHMGVEWHLLVPAFLTALATSESLDDFIRHLLNACRTIAFGLDEGSSELLAELRTNISLVAENSSQHRFRSKNKDLVDNVVSAYEAIAAYRQAFAQKQWRRAEVALDSAKSLMSKAGLPQMGEGLDIHIDRTCTCHGMWLNSWKQLLPTQA
jgi:hypothetical protein